MEVKIKRMLKGLNQKDFAKMVGISNVTLVKVERGQIDTIKFGTLKKIAENLGTTIEELFLNK